MVGVNHMQLAAAGQRDGFAVGQPQVVAPATAVPAVLGRQQTLWPVDVTRCVRRAIGLVGTLTQRIDPVARGHAVLDHARQAIEGVVAEGGGTA